MKILVTGGTGFLGRNLVNRLKNDGHQVTAIGRNITIGQELLATGISFKQVDFTNEDAIIQACCNQEYVIHCGALSSPWGKYDDFYQNNVIGTKNIIRACQINGIRRLIHVSTPSIYMEYRDRYQIKESDVLPPKPVNFYAKTKRLAEELVDAASKKNLPVITIRPRGLFGPGDQAIFPRIIRANNAHGIPDFDKKTIIDITYIDNVVDALVLCLSAGEKCFGGKYNITNGEPMELKKILTMLFQELDMSLHFKKLPYGLSYSMAALAEFYAKLMPGAAEPEITRYGVGVLYYSQTLDITKAKLDLGFQPQISIKEGIKRFAQWQRDKQ